MFPLATPLVAIAALTLGASAFSDIFDATITPGLFPTTVFSNCRTTEPTAIHDFNSCTFNNGLNAAAPCLGLTDYKDPAISSQLMACCTNALRSEASCFTDTRSFCTGSISIDIVSICQHPTRVPAATATGGAGGGVGGAAATETSKAHGAHWPVATGGMVAAAVGVVGLLV